MSETKNKQGFSVLAPLLLVVVIMAGGLYVYRAVFRPDISPKKLLENRMSEAEARQTLNELKAELEMAVKSGGISPERHAQIQDQINNLVSKLGETQEVNAIRDIFGGLKVGTKSIGSSPDVQAPSNTQVAQAPSQTQALVSTNAPASPAPAPAPAPAPEQSSQSSCKSNASPVFTNHITDVSKINYVAPPPTMGAGPSLKTHSYVGTSAPAIYAPADLRLVSGAYYEGGPYTLEFEVSCEVKIRFNHITEPIPSIKSAFPSEPAGFNDSRSQELSTHPTFQAGDLLAHTTGTSQAGNWDFGVYNSTVKNKYYGDPTWGNSWVNTTAVCPFDYFPADLKVAYVNKFDSKILGGNPPDGESFCK